MQDELRRHGTSGTLLAVLATISRGPTTTSELAETLGQAFMTTSDQVDRLEAAGEVRRIPNPSDGRSRLIEVTGDGDRRLGETAPSIRELERAILASLRGDVADVADALADVRRAVDLASADRELA